MKLRICKRKEWCLHVIDFLFLMIIQANLIVQYIMYWGFSLRVNLSESFLLLCLKIKTTFFNPKKSSKMNIIASREFPRFPFSFLTFLYIKNYRSSQNNHQTSNRNWNNQNCVLSEFQPRTTLICRFHPNAVQTLLIKIIWVTWTS